MKNRILTIVILLTVPFFAQATIINTLSGVNYEWLKLTETNSLNRATVESLLVDETSELYGYQYATRHQFFDLIASYIPAYLEGLDNLRTDSEYMNGVARLFNDFGATGSDLNYLTPPSEYKGIIKSNYYLSGLYGSLDDPLCNVPQATEGDTSCISSYFSIGYDIDAEPIYATGSFWNIDAPNVHSHYNDESGNVDIGSFLVRTTHRTVPETMSFWLFGLGLLTLFKVTRRKI